MKRPLPKANPPPGLRWNSWDIPSPAPFDTAQIGLLNSIGRDTLTVLNRMSSSPEAWDTGMRKRSLSCFTEPLGRGSRRSDDRPSEGTREGAGVLRLDGTPGRVDCPGLSPRRRLHAGAVDEVSGLPHREGAPCRPCPDRAGRGRRGEPVRHHRPRPRVPDPRARLLPGARCPEGRRRGRPETRAAISRSSCWSRWKPSAPCSSTSISATRPPRRSAPGEMCLTASGRR